MKKTTLYICTYIYQFVYLCVFFETNQCSESCLKASAHVPVYRQVLCRIHHLHAKTYGSLECGSHIFQYFENCAKMHIASWPPVRAAVPPGCRGTICACNPCPSRTKYLLVSSAPSKILTFLCSRQHSEW